MRLALAATGPSPARRPSAVASANVPARDRAASGRRLRAVPASAPSNDPDALLTRTARGEDAAFAALYDALGGAVYGLVRRVLRDPAQSEEVAQEVFLEVWRTAARYDADRGSASTWILTLAHRRAVDRVRSEQASRNREDRVGAREQVRGYDEVAEAVVERFEHAEVRAALDQLTDLQREAIELAYFNGYTYREVAELLDTPLGTVKTRMRDGLIRLRDALGVT